MPSLALIFHLINVASGKARGPISVDCVERAAAWCEYLEGHARRVYTSSITAEYQAARNLVRKIQKGELHDRFDLRDVYRKQWSLLRTKEEALASCQILLETGRLKEKQISDGGRAKTIYLINPRIKQGAQS